MNIDILKKIILKYRPNKKKCIANVNKYISLKDVYQINNLEIACLLTNYKDIYTTSNLKILNKIDPIFISLIENYKIRKKIKKISYFIYYSNLIKEKKIILFNKSGYKNSLLIQLTDLQINLKILKNINSFIELDNPYLNGLLLNYRKSDIKFFYQVNFFRESLKDNLDIKITDNNQFKAWPENIKNNFYKFKKKYWLKSQYYKYYKLDKKEAESKLNFYKSLSIKEIKFLIKKEKELIKSLC